MTAGALLQLYVSYQASEFMHINDYTYRCANISSETLIRLIQPRRASIYQQYMTCTVRALCAIHCIHHTTAHSENTHTGAHLYGLPCCHDNSSRRREGGHRGSHALHGNVVSVCDGQDLRVLGGQNGGSGQRLGLLRDGEVQEREGHRLTLRALFGRRLLALRSRLHAHAGVDGLMTPQVVAVLELLAADGADVSGAGRSGHGLH